MIRCLAPLALAVPALVQGSAAQTPVDPFAATLRWSHGPGAGPTWIPRDVAFVPGGELLWAAPAVGTPHLALYAAGATLDPVAPLLTGPSLPGAIGAIGVAVGADARELYAAAQFPDPTGSERRTEVVRYDALAAGVPFLPVWTHTLSVKVDGPARIAADATGALVCAVRDSSTASIVVEWLDAASGQVLSRLSLAGGSLQALAMSAGGGRVALVAGLDLWLVERSGATLYHETLAATTACLALAGDGGTLIVGGFGAARVLVEQPSGGFALLGTIAGEAGELAVRAAVSHDGRTFALGWWNFVNGVDVRFESFDGASGALLHSLTQRGTPGGLQNFVEAIEVARDGERIAVALWGLGGADLRPDLLLFERGTSAPLQAWHLPGSPFALDLDASATRLAVAMKDAHANEFATTGEVRLYDTGERDLQTTAPVRPGGTLELSFLHAGALQAIFALGTPDSAQALGGVQGWLLLDPAQPVHFLPAPTDAAGRADASFGLPPGPALIGLGFGAQAAALTATEAVLSRALVLPVVL